MINGIDILDRKHYSLGMTEVGQGVNKPIARRRFVGALAAAGALLGTRAVSPTPVEGAVVSPDDASVERAQGSENSLDIKRLKLTPIRAFEKFVVQKVDSYDGKEGYATPSHDRSKASVVRLESGEVGFAIDIDPETIIGEKFADLKIYYSNGGGPVNSDVPNATSYTARYIPIEQVRQMLDSQDRDLPIPEADRRLRLLLVNKPLDKPYANVLVIPETKIPTEDILNTPGPWTVDHGSEWVKVAGVTKTSQLEQNQNGELEVKTAEINIFEVNFADKLGVGAYR